MREAITRRHFVGSAFAPLLALAGERCAIRSVRAAPLPLLPARRFGTPEFQGDFDPARYRWFGPFSQLTGAILVRIDTDQGVTGFGMGGGGGAAVYIIEHHLRDLLTGANALNVELLWDQIFSSTSFYGRKGVAIQALSGIDLALWDIAAKIAGKPVYLLLGGLNKEKARAYFTGSGVDLGLKLGFTAFKLPVDTGPDQGEEGKRRIVRQVMSARKAIGPENLLMIDCLCRWNVEYTIEMAERLAEANLYFIEEPILPDDYLGYQRLCREVRSTRIASGEHEFTHFGFRELLRQKAAHVLQPDLTWSGGLTTGRRVAAMALAAGVPVMPHRGSSLYGIHLVLSSAACTMAESFGTGEPGNEMMERLTAPFQSGHYFPPDGPGFGVDFPEAVLRKHTPGLL
jgi:L-rhamnonate dehydratase